MGFPLFWTALPMSTIQHTIDNPSLRDTPSTKTVSPLTFTTSKLRHTVSMKSANNSQVSRFQRLSAGGFTPITVHWIAKAGMRAWSFPRQKTFSTWTSKQIPSSTSKITNSGLVSWMMMYRLPAQRSEHSGSTHIGEKGNELQCLLSTSGGATVATDVLFNLL